MAINVYEGMFIFDSGRFGRDPEGVSGAISETIESAGGEILVSRLWEERRLAYPINGHKKGTYWLTYFRVEGQQLPKITRQSELNDNVLRCLLLKVDPRIVETLVEHAKSGTSAARPGDTEGDKKKEGGSGESEEVVTAAAGVDDDGDED